MSNPHVTLDPDPLHVADPIDRFAYEQELWDAGYAAAIDDRRWRVAALLIAALSGAIVGALVVAVVALR